MTNPLILIDAINLAPYPVAPFTHVLDIKVGLWTHTSRLELPGIDIKIRPSATPHNYVLTVDSSLLATAEPFDRRLGSFAHAVSETIRAYEPHFPQHPWYKPACHHLLQGVASALVYFGRQFGYIEVDAEGEVTATNKRKEGGI